MTAELLPPYDGVPFTTMARGAGKTASVRQQIERRLLGPRPSGAQVKEAEAGLARVYKAAIRHGGARAGRRAAGVSTAQVTGWERVVAVERYYKAHEQSTAVNSNGEEP